MVEMRWVVPVVVVATICLAAVLAMASITGPTELDEVHKLEQSSLTQLNHALDSALLQSDNTVAVPTSRSSILAAPSPATVASSPNFEKSVASWAHKQREEALEDAVMPAASVHKMESQQSLLQQKLARLLAKKVTTTSDKVNHVLSSQQKIREENLHDIVTGLTTDHLSTTVKPFTSDLEKSHLLRDDTNQLSGLENQLDHAIASNIEIERNGGKAPISSLAAAKPAKKAPAPAASSHKLRSWAWDSPKGQDSVPYSAFHKSNIVGGGINEMRSHLNDARDRIRARLRSKLRHAQHRLEHRRVDWAKKMPDLNWQVTGHRWKSYIGQGKIQADLDAEYDEMDKVKEDMNSKIRKEKELAAEVAEARRRMARGRTAVDDLETEIKRDQEDLDIAESNANNLRGRLDASRHLYRDQQEYHQYFKNGQ